MPMHRPWQLYERIFYHQVIDMDIDSLKLPLLRKRGGVTVVYHYSLFLRDVFLLRQFFHLVLKDPERLLDGQIQNKHEFRQGCLKDIRLIDIAGRQHTDPCRRRS